MRRVASRSLLIALICVINGRSQSPRGLRRGFVAARLLGLRVRIPLGHRCLSVVSVVCCQVKVFATGESLVQRCVVCLTECDLETSTMRRLRSTTSFEPRKQKQQVINFLFFSTVTPHQNDYGR